MRNATKKYLFAAIIAALCVSGLCAQPQIIAHRGYWDKAGASQNSIAALKNAVALGVYGSELDVWLSADGVPVLSHDEQYLGVDIESASYDRLSALQLSNDEFMPALKQCISVVRNEQRTKLIIEIKSHEATKPKPTAVIDYEKKTVAAVVKLVDESGVAGIVDYISFSENVCNELIQLNPQHRVAYLAGNKTPKELKAAGYWGLDYSQETLRKNPSWIKEAKALGLTVNVWTVNKADDMKFFIDLGVDYITTDNPQLLTGILYQR